MLPYPNIDPIIFEIGPLAVRWYSLAYIIGIIGGTWYADRINLVTPSIKQIRFSDDFIIWAVLGIVLGGRFGYVFFYNTDYYLHYPNEILMVWQGGMSFHGGLLGVMGSFWYFSWKIFFINFIIVNK